MENKEYTEYGQDNEYHSYPTGKKDDGYKIKPTNTLKRMGSTVIAVVAIFLMVPIIFLMVNKVGAGFIHVGEKTNELINTAIVEEYKKENLQEFEIKGKTIGSEGGRIEHRVNYFEVKSNGKEEEIRVPIELYREYTKGDTIKLWNDVESPYLLTEDNKIISRFQ